MLEKIDYLYIETESCGKHYKILYVNKTELDNFPHYNYERHCNSYGYAYYKLAPNKYTGKYIESGQHWIDLKMFKEKGNGDYYGINMQSLVNDALNIYFKNYEKF